MIPTNELSQGEHDGKIVWICDYRFNDFNDKPIRHVPPTKVIIRPNSETKQRVYYSLSFFSPVKADGTPYAKVIKLFDNTGYRSYSGVALNVFETEEECRAHYKMQCEELIEQVNAAKLATVTRFDSIIEDLESQINPTK